MTVARRGMRSLRGTLWWLVAALALVLALLITVAVAGMVLSTNSYRDVAELTVSRQGAANRLLTDFLDAESGNRGYTLTGRGDYLTPYTDARRRYQTDLLALHALVREDRPLDELVGTLDLRAQRWFEEARTLIALRRQDRALAVRRVNSGIARARSEAFRVQFTVIQEDLEERRVESLEAADHRQAITLSTVSGVALLALGMVGFAARRLWRRVGGPIALLAIGVGRVARGRMGDVPASEGAVRELADLTTGFNLMQRQVFQQRDAVTAAVRREAVQRTERRLWETVQEGLLPARLPVPAGYRLVARYRPTERALLIGGDFYDAELLPGGRLAMIVGDMAGHGAPAAAQAAGLRFGWRTMVAVDPYPARVLSALNAQMARPELRAEGLYATVIYALVEPDGSGIFACAGHHPPLLQGADGCIGLRPAGVGPVLGAIDDAEWPITGFQLNPGDTFVMFTDGLIEARAGDEMFGVPRVCDILTTERTSAVEARLARLVAAARRFDDGSLRDDVVVMALERVRPIPV